MCQKRPFFIRSARAILTTNSPTCAIFFALKPRNRPPKPHFRSIRAMVFRPHNRNTCSTPRASPPTRRCFSPVLPRCCRKDDRSQNDFRRSRKSGCNRCMTRYLKFGPHARVPQAEKGPGVLDTCVSLSLVALSRCGARHAPKLFDNRTSVADARSVTRSERRVISPGPVDECVSAPNGPVSGAIRVIDPTRAAVRLPRRNGALLSPSSR